MPERELPVRGDRLGQEDDSVRAAVRYAVMVSAAGVGFLLIAILWVSTCGSPGEVDTVACGRPERFLLALGAPVILLIGGIGAFVRTYRVWRREGTWWGWQGAGWFLFSLMMLILTMSFPVLAGYLGS